MTESRLVDYLDQLHESASLACSYIEGLSKAEFLKDKKTQQAVILNIIVIGELATKLSRDHASFLDKHPSIPWKSMRGMRNRIAHGYFDIDLAIAWDTVHTGLPELLAALPAIQAGARSLS